VQLYSPLKSGFGRNIEELTSFDSGLRIGKAKTRLCIILNLIEIIVVITIKNTKALINAMKVVITIINNKKRSD